MPQDLEGRIAKLEEALRGVTDREAIRDLRCRYHECINEGDLARIPSLFAEGGEIDFGHLGRAKGAREIGDFFARELTQVLPFIMQFIHNHVVEVSGESGRGFAYLEAKPIYKGEPYLVAARYDDEYVREDGEWKFKRMALTPIFMVPFREGWAVEDRIKMGR
jgi:hypothetical protein